MDCRGNIGERAIMTKHKNPWKGGRTVTKKISLTQKEWDIFDFFCGEDSRPDFIMLMLKIFRLYKNGID
jgi:hypothetical protein